MFYEYQKDHPEFAEEKKVLKGNINLQARINVGRSVKAGNIDDSKWWLSKMDPEFKNSVNIS